jgi:Family of unknown function (DUF5691)
MSLPSDIVSDALVGTERQAAALQAGADALGRVLSQLDPAQREAALLGAAGVHAIYHSVGALPVPSDAPALAPAPVEELAYCSPVANDHLRMMLAGQYSEVLHEWLAAAAKVRKIARPELLPKMLELGRTKPEFREPILPLLGNRGRWLATHNTDWGYVAGDGEDESIWQTGSRPARILLLQRLRARDPNRARELLASTWAQEPAEERARFMPALQTGLSFADEPFLETALDDRRKEVRDEAARLLAIIPESRFSARMIERARPLLKLTTGSPSKAKGGNKKKSGLEVVLPESCDAAMKRDGIGVAAQSGKGEKGGWLAQIVGAVPPKLWQEILGKSPSEILAAAEGNDWETELLSGWVQAAGLHRDINWAETLLPAFAEAKYGSQLDSLMGVLPPEKCEAVALKTMAEAKKPDFNDPIQFMLLQECQHAWSAGFTRRILEYMRAACASEKQSFGWQLRELTRGFACRMDPALAKEAEARWPTDSAAWEHSAETINQMLTLLQFRRAMLEAL